MSITEKLLASKNALASLLTFANAKTGKADPDIGEAIRTLVDGYGQGGGSSALVIEQNFKGRGCSVTYCYLPPDGVIVRYLPDTNSFAVPTFSNCYTKDASTPAKITWENTANCTIPIDFLRDADHISEVVFRDGVRYVGRPTRFCAGFNKTSQIIAKMSGIILDESTGFDLGVYQCPGLDARFMGSLKLDSTINFPFTAEAMHDLIMHLEDYSGGEAHTITLGSKTVNRPTAEDIAFAASRNWTFV